MTLVLDAAVHVHAAAGARIPLDHRVGVDDLQLLLSRRDLDLVAPDDGDLRKQRAGGLPALGTAADVVVRRLRGEGYRDRPLRALAFQSSARERSGALLHAAVDGRV